jgi:hypothetical protein
MQKLLPLPPLAAVIDVQRMIDKVIHYAQQLVAILCEEETSREKQKQESVKKALEYALKNQNPVADDATSNTQIPRSKSGYCYIGEDRGFRSCIEVSQDMKCMSGDIFPTMDVCVNPRLRV